MGRYVALGIACEIQFCKRKNTSTEEFDLIRKDLKNNIEKYINVDDYYVTDEDDLVYYRIKEEVVNKNIHNLLKEIGEQIHISSFENSISDGKYDIKVSDEKFNQDDYPLELKFLDENYQYKDESDRMRNCNSYRLFTPHSIIKTDIPHYRDNYWMIYFQRDLLENTSGDAAYLNIWIDIDSITSKDQTTLIKMLNSLLLKCFENPLAKDLQFYISG